MTLSLPPDPEKALSKYLRSQPDIAALGARIVGKTPDDTSTPWVRVTELDGRPTRGDTTDRLIDYLVQFDCYAGADGGQPEAKLLGRTVRAALVALRNQALDGAHVSGVEIASSGRFPDADFEPARERMILRATVWAR